MSEAIQVERLSEFRGAPFSETAVASAVESIRAQCGWHIAPERETTERVKTVGRSKLYLTTLNLLEVVEVRDALNSDAEPYSGRLWVDDNGVIEALDGDLPERVEVTYRHGYNTFPDALLPVVADRARSATQGRIQSESLASRSVTMASGVDPLTAPMLAAWKIGRRAS